ncbi:DMT family transporter [Phaeovulum sp.]|uniref:DMT family transporter n=1 Tax=Phaeovulum sp. TaxID=2934796 RepID=UPI00272F5FC9|nr:DMT family transporter [Phaeovulum sp.]MDP1668843.1 DMT family transporter [Phaeovulum sp.]MDZ4117893.1 DMT family transporter [Phaeovulum sp.]
MVNNNFKGALLALLALGIFATHDVVVKMLGRGFSPFQIIFFASLISFPMVTLILLRDRAGGSLRPNNPRWVAMRTVMTLITGIAAFYAFSHLPLAQTYSILFASPLLITVMAIPILGERVRLRRWAAVVVGLVGVLVVLRPGAVPLSMGHLAALTAAVCGAFATVIVRKIGNQERPLVLMIYPMTANFLFTGAALPFVYQPMTITELGLMAVIALFGLTASYLSILAYRLGEAVIVAPMQYSQMLWAIGYGWFLFGESVDTYTLIGAAIIIASGLYIVLRESRAGNSENTPVLQSQGRAETVTTPRGSILQRLLNPGGRGEH